MERLFVDCYLANGCIGAKAYREAGYRAKNSHVAAVMANRLLRKADIARSIKERRDDALRAARVTANDVLASKARDLNFDPAKLFYTQGRKKGQLKPIHELDENTRRALRVEIDGDGNVKSKGPDYNTAREQAMKHFGLYERDNKHRLNWLSATHACGCSGSIEAKQATSST